MSVLPCVTFLLTLQESDFLVDLFCNLDIQAQNPDFLGANWQEIAEINYNFRNIYDSELIASLVQNKNPNFFSKKITNLLSLGQKKTQLDLGKISKLNLAKNLEIISTYWQYQSVVNSLQNLSELEQNLGSGTFFFGRNLTNLIVNFQDYISQILKNINQKTDFSLEITSQILEKLTLTDLLKNNSSNFNLEKAKNSPKMNWQAVFCPTELAGDLALFAQNKQNYLPKITENSELKASLENKNSKNEIEQGLADKLTINYNSNLENNFENSQKSTNDQEGSKKLTGDLEAENLSEVSEFAQNLEVENQNFAKNKILSLFDFDGLSILLRQQKFELEGRFKKLDFILDLSQKNTNNETLTDIDNFFQETFFRIKLEQKINFYRFEVAQNLPVANYKKSQIIVVSDKNEAKKTPLLSFLIVSLPQNQAQKFFKLISPHKVAFAEIIPPQDLVFWQTKPQIIQSFLKNFSNLAPINSKNDPSFIFWRFLIFNAALTISDLGSSFYLLTLAILASFYRNSWCNFWTNFLFQVSVQSAFLGILFGSFWTNFWSKSNMAPSSSILNFFGNFQIISFWDPNSPSFLNQILNLNSPTKLVVMSFLLFGIVGVFQFIWSYFYSRKLSQSSSLENKRKLKMKKFNLAFSFYLILAVIFLGQIWLNFWLHEKISNNLYWLILQPFIFILTFTSAFWTSLQINQHFLLPRIYEPTATKLEPERQNLESK